jgi:hypothetical protein
MATALYVQGGGTINFTNSSGSNIGYKNIIVTAAGIFIAGEAIANGETGSVHTE